jgi:hypothetical protein
MVGVAGRHPITRRSSHPEMVSVPTAFMHDSLTRYAQSRYVAWPVKNFLLLPFGTNRWTQVVDFKELGDC